MPSRLLAVLILCALPLIPLATPADTKQATPSVKAEPKTDAALSLPAEVKGEVAAFVSVPATTECVNIKWAVLDPGLNLFPIEALKDSKTAVVSAAKDGKYRIMAVGAVGNIPTTPQICTVVIGKPTEEAKVGRQGPPGARGPPGVPGKDGAVPAHEWQGTSLRFKNPDGTWGALVDLKGAKGDKGDKGDSGSAPPVDPPVTETSLHFMLIRPDGAAPSLDYAKYLADPAWVELSKAGYLTSDKQVTEAKPWVTLPADTRLPCLVVFKVSKDHKKLLGVAGGPLALPPVDKIADLPKEFNK